jgi:hypothetical protein
MADQRPPDVPEELRQMIRLNVTYQVLICPDEQCRRAIQPSAFARHSWEVHETTLGAREQLKGFIDELRWKKNPRTVDLPKDGSKPQPIIPVVDVFECESCEPDPNRRPFRSRSDKCAQTHWYKVNWDTTHEEEGHKKRGAAIYRQVRGQTWFWGGGEARYWWVCEEPVGSADDEEDGTREGLPIDSRTGVEAVEAIRGDSINAVDGPVIVIPSDDEVEAIEAPVIIIDSDDEVLVPTRRGPVRVVDDGVDSSDDESFGDADYEPSSSSGEESAGGEGESSETDRGDDEDSEECDTVAEDEGDVIATSSTRKRKIQRAFEDWAGCATGPRMTQAPRPGRDPRSGTSRCRTGSGLKIAES